jgi:hypothetical protein
MKETVLKSVIAYGYVRVCAGVCECMKERVPKSVISLQTVSISVGVGTACTLYEPVIVLEALILTAAVVTGLTIYTFRAARKGADFGFMGPILFTGALPSGSLAGPPFFLPCF